jgi:hypothetical protein
MELRTGVQIEIVRLLSVNWVQNGTKRGNSADLDFNLFLRLDVWRCRVWRFHCPHNPTVGGWNPPPATNHLSEFCEENRNDGGDLPAIGVEGSRIAGHRRRDSERR